MSEKLEFGGHEVIVDPHKLQFDEMSLNDYIQTEAAQYDYFGGSLALAEKNLQIKEMQHERFYNERFIEAKEEGAAVALAESKAKVDPVVADAKEAIINAKYIVNRLKQHLKAWDKNHDNAMSLGHMLRKQIDKLHGDFISGSRDGSTPGLDDAVERTVTSFDPDPKPVPEIPPEEVGGFETELTADNLF